VGAAASAVQRAQRGFRRRRSLRHRNATIAQTFRRVRSLSMHPLSGRFVQLEGHRSEIYRDGFRLPKKVDP